MIPKPITEIERHLARLKKLNLEALANKDEGEAKISYLLFTIGQMSANHIWIERELEWLKQNIEQMQKPPF